MLFVTRKFYWITFYLYVVYQRSTNLREQGISLLDLHMDNPQPLSWVLVQQKAHSSSCNHPRPQETKVHWVLFIPRILSPVSSSVWRSLNLGCLVVSWVCISRFFFLGCTDSSGLISLSNFVGHSGKCGCWMLCSLTGDTSPVDYNTI